jgi:D-threo-aldose 1-dehydrogenase
LIVSKLAVLTNVLNNVLKIFALKKGFGMTDTLVTRQIGKTSLHISTLGFGAASMGNLYHEVTDSDARATLNTAKTAGINYFDTAPRYGAGLSERRIGDAVRPLDKSNYVLSTKVGRLLTPDRHADITQLRHGFHTPMPFEAHYDYSYDGIMRSYQDSLQRLGLAQIDILLVHDLGQLTHGTKDKHYFYQFESSGYKALEELKKSGQIKAIGLGVNEVDICKRVMNITQFDCFLLAGRYTLLEQTPLDDFFPMCQDYGASIILGGPYNSGILATGIKKNITPYYDYAPASKAVIKQVNQIEAVCEEFNVPLAAAALQFPLGHSVVSSVIPGIGSAKRLAHTIKLFNRDIPNEFWQTLKNRHLLADNAPTPLPLSGNKK